MFSEQAWFESNPGMPIQATRLFRRPQCCHSPDCLLGLYWTGPILVNGFHIFSYFSFFLFWARGRLSWLSCQLSSARQYSIVTSHHHHITYHHVGERRRLNDHDAMRSSDFCSDCHLEGVHKVQLIKFLTVTCKRAFTNSRKWSRFGE